MREQIQKLIVDYVEQYQEKHGTETAWRRPVVGFADADDPLFGTLKEVIGPNHALPSDIVPGARTVITYFVPFSKEVIDSNVEGEESSRAWDIANIDTNQLLKDLNQQLHQLLTEKGFHASLLPPTYNYDEEKLVSDWSHKSAAYISGIGTFGVHHVLITEQGCCGRLGSVITDLDVPHTKHLGEEYCLYRSKGICKKCVERCPNGAFCVHGKDIEYNRWRCNEQIYDKIVPVYPSGTGDTCGKCMCGVPCAFCRPE